MVSEDAIAPNGLVGWDNAQRTLQPAEAWETFKDWVDRVNPRMQFSVARNRGRRRRQITSAERARAASVRDTARSADAQAAPGEDDPLPADDAVSGAAARAGPVGVLDPLRERITRLACHGGASPACRQVSIPGCTVDGLPIGLLDRRRLTAATPALVAVARALGASRPRLPRIARGHPSVQEAPP